MEVNVKDFGAFGDGTTNDQEAIQKAIDVCYEQKGGTVFLENGVFLSGTIYLRSNVFLKIDASAVLAAYADISCYGDDTHRNRYRNEPELDRCWIYAENEENIGLIGYGKLDGHAESFPNRGSIYRPMMIRFLKCRGIHLENLRLYNAAAWTCAFLDCSYIWTENLDIQNEKNYNGDGLDFDGCNHVYVSNCNICGTDDNLCLQAGNRKYPMEDVHITNCSFQSVCAAIRIGLKSIGDIKNVVISNCIMHNVWREGIKIECTEGGNISDVNVSNIVMRNVSRPIFVILNNAFDPDGLGNSVELTELPEIGHVERIQFQTITVVDEEEMRNIHKRFDDDVMGAPYFGGIRVDAAKAHPIDGMTISHLNYVAIGGVKMLDLPLDYPEVLDKRLHPDKKCSSNYYPDWSRAVFMDIRNVNGLCLETIVLKLLRYDERKPVIFENCKFIREPEICFR